MLGSYDVIRRWYRCAIDAEPIWFSRFVQTIRKAVVFSQCNTIIALRKFSDIRQSEMHKTSVRKSRLNQQQERLKQQAGMTHIEKVEDGKIAPFDDICCFYCSFLLADWMGEAPPSTYIEHTCASLFYRNTQK